MSPVLSLIQISGRQYVLQSCGSIILGPQVAGLPEALAVMESETQRLHRLLRADARLASEVAATARVADPMQRALAATQCVNAMRFADPAFGTFARRDRQTERSK